MAKSKRRRKRRGQRRPPSEAPAPERESAPPRRAARARPAKERPPAPWGSFPLVEIAVLVGIVLLVWGFIQGGERGGVFILAGLGMASIAGLELAIREHFSGFRSHTALLSGAVAVLSLLAMTAAGLLEPEVRIAVAVALFGLAALGLARWFRRRTGQLVKLR